MKGPELDTYDMHYKNLHDNNYIQQNDSRISESIEFEDKNSF